MSSGILCSSHGLVLATAMLVSSTVIFLTFSGTSRPKTLRSCLSSSSSSSEGKKKNKKKKKVHFAENVKEPSSNGEEYRKEQTNKLIAEERARSRRSRQLLGDGFCRGDLELMPANRIALYNGILRDRSVHRMDQCSY